MTELAAMSPLTALAVSVLLMTSAGIGLWLRLPAHHIDPDSREVVKSVLGLLSTMSAVLLSLLIASSKNSYDTQKAEMQEIATKLVLLDRTLARYGPETTQSRRLLRAGMEEGIRRIWESGATRDEILAMPRASQQFSETMMDALQDLRPHTDVQKLLQAQALQTMTVVAQLRILMSAQGKATLSLPLLAILVSWTICLFFGYGLFARRNATVIISLLIGALAVAGAIFLMVELNRPYAGLLRIPESIMRDALALMGPV